MKPWLRAATGLGIAAAALLALVLSRQIPSRPVKGDPGPQALPAATAIIILAGAAVASLADARGAAPAAEPWARAMVVAAATVAYIALLPAAGFLGVTALYLIAVSWYLDRPSRIRPSVRLILAVGISFVLWWTFGRLLKVVLPAGPWGF